MDIKIKSQLLKLVGSRIQGILTEKTLSYVGLKTQEPSSIIISVNDHLVAMYCAFDALVEQTGLCFVPAQLFYEVIRELPEGDVRLYTQSNTLFIEAGPEFVFKMNIPLIENGIWRESEVLMDGNSAEISSEKLSYLLTQVNFCISQDCTRSFGTVGYLHRPLKSKNTLRLVGSDGYRLSLCDITVNLQSGFLEKGVCLSKKTLVELSRLSNEGFDKVKLTVSAESKCFLAEVPGYKVFFRLSSEKYPNYEKAMPAWDGSSSQVSLSKQYVHAVAKRVLLAADKSRVLNLSFEPSSLTMLSKTIGVSEGKETVKLENYQGPKCRVTLNGKFLNDVLSTISSDKIKIQFKAAEEPIILTPEIEPEFCLSKHMIVPIEQH